MLTYRLVMTCTPPPDRPVQGFVSNLDGVSDWAEFYFSRLKLKEQRDSAVVRVYETRETLVRTIRPKESK